MRPSARLIAIWVFVGIYASAIFTFSSLSDPPVPTFNFSNIDKVYHALEYAALAFLLMCALRTTFPTRSTTQLILWGVALTVLYGCSDEFHQAFTPGREMSVYDALADAVGAGLVGLVWTKMERRWPASVNSAREE